MERIEAGNDSKRDATYRACRALGDTPKQALIRTRQTPDFLLERLLYRAIVTERIRALPKRTRQHHDPRVEINDDCRREQLGAL